MLHRFPVIAPALEVIDQEIVQLRAALALAEAARRQLQTLESPDAGDSPAPLTGALLAYVTAHPGSTRPEVVQATLAAVPTKSRNPEKNVRTRLGQLVTRKRIAERAGRLYAA